MNTVQSSTLKSVITDISCNEGRVESINKCLSTEQPILKEFFGDNLNPLEVPTIIGVSYYFFSLTNLATVTQDIIDQYSNQMSVDKFVKEQPELVSYIDQYLKSALKMFSSDEICHAMCHLFATVYWTLKISNKNLSN